MSANNSVRLIGYIGGKVREEDDIELQYLPSGTAVAKFSLAVDRPKRNGEEQSPDWFRVAIYGKSAENLRQYCGKGDLLSVEGSIRTYRFQGQDGNMVSGFTIEGSDWKLLKSKGSRTSQEDGQLENAIEGGDIPF